MWGILRGNIGEYCRKGREARGGGRERENQGDVK